jgi:hypothetical protein
MSRNSLESILNRMATGNITLGWGAVAAFSRSRLNDVLRQQYLERLRSLRYLPLFNDDVKHGDRLRTRSELRKVEFGVPLLSFPSASLKDSRAQLTFPIVAGTHLKTSPLAEQLVTHSVIDEAMGYTLILDLDLKLVTGDVDRRGRVTLDLSDAAAFQCNLGDDDAGLNSLISAAMQRFFNALPKHRSVFELGMLNFDGITPLTPESFIVRTQAAPGAQVRGADNYGDGAVLTFIKLLGNHQAGQAPDTGFPYLIPDDLDGAGESLYSAALVVDKDMLQHVSDGQTELLTSLLFPGYHTFVERERHTPHDLAVFGNIAPQPSLFTIDPWLHTVRAGESVQFTLHDRDGKALPASQWRARSRQGHSDALNGTINANGLYRSVDAARIGHDSLTIAISAEVMHEGVLHTATAELKVQFEREQIAPRVSVSAGLDPVPMVAALSGDSPVSWTLLGDPLGKLEQVQGNRATFVAQRDLQRRQLGVQQVQAKAAAQRLSTVVLLNGLPSVDLQPARAMGLGHRQTTQLGERYPDLLPEARRRWRLIGPGTLDQNGLFTAPDSGQGASVVTCELVHNGVVLAAGHSVLEFAEAPFQDEPTWTTLASYAVLVPGGEDNQTRGQLISNGFQALRVQVIVETEQASDGQFYRLSADEEASICLVFKDSKQRLPFLDSDDPNGGINDGDINRWATRRVPNRFLLAYAQLPAAGAEVRNEQAITRKDLYLHCTDIPGSAQQLYSEFSADLGGTFTSIMKGEGERSQMLVTPKAVPAFDDDHYTLEWRRVKGDVVDGRHPPVIENFSRYPRSLDYWTFKIRGSRFETLEFLPREPGLDINYSMIRWESESPLEMMFSFTGYIFRDTLKAWKDPMIVFDENLEKIMPGREELKQPVDLDSFSSGALVISNHRVTHVDWVDPSDNSAAAIASKRLSKGIAVLLRDSQGNAHRRLISFRPKDQLGHRCYLEHSVLLP